MNTLRGISMLLIILMLFLFTGCTKEKTDETKQVEITISAAASLHESLLEIKKSYEKRHPEVELLFNFGGSGALQQQIAQGAPTDIFISAAEEPFKQLVNDGFIHKNDQMNLLKNKLVLIVANDNPQKITSLKDLLKKKVKTIASGTPTSVPVGEYTREALTSLQIWEDVKHKIVFAKDVRQVLTYVETKSADAGLVYVTDALTSQKVKVVTEIDEKNHRPIIYPVGIVKGAKNEQEAVAFFKYLQTKEASEIFEKRAFSVIGSEIDE